MAGSLQLFDFCYYFSVRVQLKTAFCHDKLLFSSSETELQMMSCSKYSARTFWPRCSLLSQKGMQRHRPADDVHNSHGPIYLQVHANSCVPAPLDLPRSRGRNILDFCYRS